MLAEGFVSLDIDPRGFVYRPVPAEFNAAEADLWGSARDQWRWWYRGQRLKLRGALRPLIAGEIGRMEGMRFVGDSRPFVVIAGLPGDAESEAMLAAARLVLGHPIVNVILGEHLEPASFDSTGRLQVFKFEKPEAMPALSLARHRKERPAHERIAAQRDLKRNKPRRR
jgi:hypothetical protein